MLADNIILLTAAHVLQKVTVQIKIQHPAIDKCTANTHAHIDRQIDRISNNLMSHKFQQQVFPSCIYHYAVSLQTIYLFTLLIHSSFPFLCLQCTCCQIANDVLILSFVKISPPPQLVAEEEKFTPKGDRDTACRTTSTNLYYSSVSLHFEEKEDKVHPSGVQHSVRVS